MATSPPPTQSGIKTVLRYTGIPPSWLDKKPKLPSRNWLIFLSVTSSVLGFYLYDRQQCKQIRQSYIDKVKHLAEIPSDPLDAPRKVTVFGAKWPADEDYDQAMKHFRKYVKPILVAAAVDYEMVTGKRHGDIAKRVAEEVRKRRRLDAGLDQDSEVVKVLPTYKTPDERRRRELDGGIVIIGRPTFKEFMAGLQKGWSGSLEKIDAEEELARELENDTHFDEPEDPRDFADHEPATDSKQSPLQPSPSPASSSKTSLIYSDSTSTIPPLPPLLLVPFTDLIGLKQIPLMIWGFFNQRHKVRSGAEAGYRLVMKQTRPIQVPDTLNENNYQASEESSREEATPSLGDLDFDKESEGYYKKSMDEFPDEVENNRQKYYDALPAKLAIARELARGTREPTKAELENPPPTEVELRAERLKKEKRWRDDLEGWNIIKPSQNVPWDTRFKDAMRVFVDPPRDEDDTIP
ncbi:mitochondrial import inner membrane translocase subunit TIM54 [Gymnopilus junonius]|uniref:Mitochondrial import inner membrane translocase subunit TIM54 n=1 Tax=Gymnopilus junonius TaxID=109634 RepID=A0A9P5NZZ9_GYMJU|nr:mitochondrial import inner membrane translocase subunit TIM54 [Gymnopilus junonius]